MSSLIPYLSWQIYPNISFEVCYSFVGFVYVSCLIHQSVAVFCLVLPRKSAAQFFSNVHVTFVFRGRSAVQFLFVFVNFSIAHVCFVFCHVQFFVFFNFSNAHVCFVLRHRIAVQCFCIFWVERNFFSLTVFGGNLLAGNVHSRVTMDRHVQA